MSSHRFRLAGLAFGSLTAAALLLALTTMPAIARPFGTNGQLTFGRFDPVLGDTTVYTANPNGSHERQVPPIALECPHWSPDGRAITTCGAPDGGATLIVDPDTGSYREVPNPDPATYFMPCAIPSPDFTRLACEGFGLTETDQSLNGIYTLRTSDGGDLRRITKPPPGGDDEPGDYAPDGRRIVYHGGPNIFTVKTDGTGRRAITPSYETSGTIASSSGSWSPQGNEIVLSRRLSSDIHSSLWLVHADGSDLRPIPLPSRIGCGLPNGTPGSAGCVDPHWSSDGRKVMFRRVPDGADHGDVYTISADGTCLRQVTHDGDVDFGDWGTHPLAHN
jgi:Tol biopolymer transport system component